MAENLQIESPDFDRIKKGDHVATKNAILLLWEVLNQELRLRRQNDRRIEERLSPKVLSVALAASKNNYDTQGAGLVLYTGADAYNVTGYLSREEGDILFIHNTGAGTITHKNADASSDAGNRMAFASGADKAVAQNKSLVLQYLSSRWRELSLA